MREVGRALALDPDNADALRTLVDLITQPPDEAPREVEDAILRAEERGIREMARVGAFSYAAMLAFLPLLAASGVRSWASLVFIFGMLLVASFLSYRQMRVERPSQLGVFMVFLASTAAFAATSQLFGAFVVTPAAISINTTLFALNFRRDVRWLTIGVGCVTLGMLVGIECFAQTTYAISSSGIIIRPGAISFGPVATLIALAVVSMANIATGPLALMGLRENLRRAERRIQLTNWHMRALVPEKVQDRMRSAPHRKA